MSAGESGMGRPEPNASRDSAFFWRGLREGQLLAQRCGNCERWRHPPRPFCPHCHSPEWRAAPLSGRGRVYSWIKPVHPPLPMFESDLLIALIDLDEGIRLLSNLRDVSEHSVHNEMAVEVCFLRVGDSGAQLHQFRPLAESPDD